MTTLPHIASRVFDTPLALSQQKADVIAGAILPRIRGEMRFDSPRVRAAVGETYQPLMTQGGTIAVIPVIGTLVKRAGALDAESGLVSYQWLELELSRALTSPMIDGILLDIDSHGGEVNGLLDLGDFIRESRSRKPVYAVADDYALSAAYLLASAAERVFLTQTASVGSVGVLALHIDRSAQDRPTGAQLHHCFRRRTEGRLQPATDNH